MHWVVDSRWHLQCDGWSLEIASTSSSIWVSEGHLWVVASPCDMNLFVLACSHFSGSWFSSSELRKHGWCPFNDLDIFWVMKLKCEHVLMDQHLFSNPPQPLEMPASRQLATNRPVLIGLELEIVNSIVWRLLQILTKTVPNREAPERTYMIYLSKSTTGWVAGVHSTTVDHW
jgi:hypothetical protein